MPDNLQFDRAEPGPGAAGLTGRSRARPAQPVVDTYYVVNGHIVCENAGAPSNRVESRRRAGRFAKPSSSGPGDDRVLDRVDLVLKTTDGSGESWPSWSGSSLVARCARGQRRGGWRYQTLAIFSRTQPSSRRTCRSLSRDARAQRSSHKSNAATGKTLPVADTTTATTARRRAARPPIPKSARGFVIGVW